MWRDVFGAIHAPIQACIAHYLSRSPILQSFDLQPTGYKIQMYPRGQGFFHWHADATGRGVQSRQVAMILYLNDVAEGGETEFFHQGIKFDPRAGHLLLFPTAWNYMHRGAVPVSLSGDKLHHADVREDQGRLRPRRGIESRPRAAAIRWMTQPSPVPLIELEAEKGLLERYY